MATLMQDTAHEQRARLGRPSCGRRARLGSAPRSACGHACRMGLGRASLLPFQTSSGWQTRRSFFWCYTCICMFLPLIALFKHEAMLMESRDVIEEYLAAIETVRAAFGDMSRELLFARPVAGKWSSQEVLCHLVDTDLTIALRIRAALTRDCPRLQTATREEITTGLAVDARDAAEELTLFQTIRCETARIVRAMLPNALDRQAVLVAADGAETTRTVQQFLTGITKHVAHHLAFVYEKRRALGLAAPQAL